MLTELLFLAAIIPSNKLCSSFKTVDGDSLWLNKSGKVYATAIDCVGGKDEKEVKWSFVYGQQGGQSDEQAILDLMREVRDLKAAIAKLRRDVDRLTAKKKPKVNVTYLTNGLEVKK